ncbi:MAG: hypothetical protein JW768_02105 [Chitinispirillaceae bacterium]|nr:hypothetical protein [Chitinispirillaceae bacterium]
MRIIEKTIPVSELRTMAENRFGSLVKAVVDIRLRVIALDAELHSDEEAALLDHGSQQEDLWGINLYPEYNPVDDGFVEFDSMINLRPSQGNRSRNIDNAEIRRKIIDIVRKAVVQ